MFGPLRADEAELFFSTEADTAPLGAIETARQALPGKLAERMAFFRGLWKSALSKAFIDRF